MDRLFLILFFLKEKNRNKTTEIASSSSSSSNESLGAERTGSLRLVSSLTFAIISIIKVTRLSQKAGLET